MKIYLLLKQKLKIKSNYGRNVMPKDKFKNPLEDKFIYVATDATNLASKKGSGKVGS